MVRRAHAQMTPREAKAHLREVVESAYRLRGRYSRIDPVHLAFVTGFLSGWRPALVRAAVRELAACVYCLLRR
jgi:hypothetical protein